MFMIFLCFSVIMYYFSKKAVGATNYLIPRLQISAGKGCFLRLVL